MFIFPLPEINITKYHNQNYIKGKKKYWPLNTSRMEKQHRR